MAEVLNPKEFENPKQEFEEEDEGIAPNPNHEGSGSSEEYDEDLAVNDKVIHFYSHRDTPYGVFSNFSPHPVWLKGVKWPTSEHYFQAMKFENPKIQQKILHAGSPGRAAEIGRDRSNPLRKDWESVKNEIMYEVVLAKFTQNKALGNTLKGTGNAYIAEHTFKDNYWGDGGDGKGKNVLGQILMRVRHALLNNETDSKFSDFHVPAPSEEELEEEKISDKRLKNRRHRGVFLGEDGNSLFEMDPNSHGEVTIVGQGVNIPHKALTTPAKVVVYRNQKRRKWQATENDFSDEEEEENQSQTGAPVVQFGEYLITPNKKSSSHKRNSPPKHTKSVPPSLSNNKTTTQPQDILAAGQNLLELTKQTKDETLLKELKPQVEELKANISSLLETISEEKTMISLLELNDRLSELSL